MRASLIRNRWSAILPLLLLVAIGLALASPARPPVPTSTTSDVARGLQFRLSEGRRQAETRPSTPPRVAAKPLSPEAANRLLASLSPLPPPQGDVSPFKTRAGSLPRPRAGKTLPQPFPAPALPATGPAAADGALQVLRWAPYGNVAIAPQLSVTFSNPMVAVTSLDELAAQDVPVKLTPQPPGKWRWIGTRTLVFEPAARFPMATSYTAVVPADTRDAAGRTLGKAVRWTFTTPPPQLVSGSPTGGPHGRSPVMVAVFDQKIDAAAVLATIKTTPSTTLRLATDAEVKADATAAAVMGRTEANRAVAFVAAEPFPTATSVTVTVGPGTPSLEGPLKTDAPQTSTFRTYGPMGVEDAGCGYGGECPPLAPWHVRFTNPIDIAKFQPAMIKVSPPLAGMKVDVNGAYLGIRGMSKGRTQYTVTLDPSIPDVFGQTLGSTQPVAIKVGSARPALAGPRESYLLADPFANPSYTVFSINHPRLRVRTWRVTPADWPRYAAFMQKVNQDDVFPTPPGTLVSNELIETKGTPDDLTETRVDLRPALKNGLGNVIVVVEPPTQPKERWQRRTLTAWVQSTRIGLDAVVDDQSMTASATSLIDGHPLGGVELSLTDSTARATSADSGLATLDLPRAGAPHRLLVARHGDDVAFLPQSSYWWGSGDAWVRSPRVNALRWFVFDDRGIYKPKESMHFKGWMRVIGAGPKGEVQGLNGAVKTVRYRVVDSRGNEVAKGDAPVGAAGGFSGVVTLPDTMNLGTASLELSALNAAGLAGTKSTHRFQVEEFRRPEFEVSASATPGPYFIGSHAVVSTEAKYYAGGPLPDASVTWQVTSTPGWFSPPGHPDFTFGTWVPWFWWGDGESPATVSQRLQSRTDAAGKHLLRIDFDGVRPPQPSTVRAEATVTDVNRQAWSASATVLVHPADQYVGLRRQKLFSNPGEPVELDAIVADIDGRVVAGSPIRVRATRLDYAWKEGRLEQTEESPEEVTVTSAATPVRAVLHPKEGGTWRVRATITDSAGRPNQSEMVFWVSGGKQPPRREVEAEKLLLVPDQRDYKPGDVAHVLVQAPFANGHGTLTLSRCGIIETRAFELKGTSATLDIPIDASWTPNANLEVEVVGAADRTNDDGSANPHLPKRPAYALGSLTLRVPPLHRKLSVQAVPRDKAVKPGGETTIDVAVTDASGKPVSSGEVAVVVVDESVLALTNYKLDDPMNVFYALRGGDTRSWHGRSDLVLVSPEALANEPRGMVQAEAAETLSAGAMPAPAPAAAAPGEMRARSAPMKMAKRAARDDAEEAGGPIRTRSNFDPLACFSPSVRIENGRAAVKVTLPDNLTRYRVMAVGVSGPSSFGSGESAITARLPLMARPSAPRFLNFGDRFSLPVVLQNQTDKPLEVQVAARASNLKLEAPGYGVTVPANDRVEVLFPAATEQAGTARLQIAARSEAGADAAEVSLPVYTPATTEAFATYGTLDGSGATAQPIKAPSSVWPQFGGLEVEVSSTALQALTDAVLYLVRYPFECAEQVSSRVIGISALRDVLTTFTSTHLPAAKTLAASVSLDIEKLKRMQNDDGGFAFWRRGDPSWPYISVHVANALVRAQEKGYAVPKEMLDAVRGYLRAVESHIPHGYSVEVRNAIIAYALNVRWHMGDRDAARARRLVAEGLPAAVGNAPPKHRLSVEAAGWLLPVLAKAAPAGKPDGAAATEVATLKRFLMNRVTETAGAASFTTDYEDGQYLLLATNRRADAIVLEALVATEPSCDLIPKIVRGLLGHRSAGHWLNTQENVFVLLALDRYFHAFEKQTPDFVARVWLGADYAGEHVFKGRSTARLTFDVPMKRVAEGAKDGVKDLVIDKQGAGRLYYRIGMRYAPRDLHLKPLEAGFAVQRRYEAVDDPADVSRAADGSYTIKAGAMVRVRVTMVAPSRRVHVALVDPLPAGLEALNPALAVQGALPTSNGAGKPSDPFWYWRRPWYEHQNLRDERVEAFTSLLWEGVYEYVWYARATTPGQFVVPPPKAEEMYSPEVFGRGGTDRVTVK